MPASQQVAMSLGFGLWLAVQASVAAAAGCESYTWDVNKERALFTTVPTPVGSSQDPMSAPRIRLGQLYQVRLVANERIGRRPNDPPRAASYGGALSVEIPATGTYRLVMDNNAWVGMSSGITAEISPAYQAALECKTPSKLVEFRLEEGKVYSVLINVVPDPTMRFAITESPRR